MNLDRNNELGFESTARLNEDRLSARQSESKEHLKLCVVLLDLLWKACFDATNNVSD